MVLVHKVIMDYITRYKNRNVVGMAEQISKKHRTPGDHVVEMLQTWVP